MQWQKLSILCIFIILLYKLVGLPDQSHLFEIQKNGWTQIIFLFDPVWVKYGKQLGYQPVLGFWLQA